MSAPNDKHDREPELMSTIVKLVTVGAPKTGKTAIIRQFMYNDFPEKYRSTRDKHCYYPTMLMNDRLFEIRLIDLPHVPRFPKDSYEEWSLCPGYGMRSANAYILIFDITRAESFRYVKHMRHQITKFEKHRPIVVVANKIDLLESALLPESRELANIIHRHWRCPYIECSAKFNWHVTQIFEEILSSIDNKYNEQQLFNVPTTLRSKKCVIQ